MNSEMVYTEHARQHDQAWQELTLTRTQHPAIVGNAGNSKTLIYGGFASLCNAQEHPTAHS